MSHLSNAPQDPLAEAAVEAVLAARWECTELLSRRPSRLAAELLRGHAAELATSALAGDQVLSLALETAASDLEAGRPPLEAGAMFLFTDAGSADGARRRLRDLVLQQPGEPSSPPRDVVAEIERRCADEGLTPSQLSRRLAASAHLQNTLWDDPRLPAQVPVRLAMLHSAPKLSERAAELARPQPRPSRSSASAGTIRQRPSRGSLSVHHAGWVLAAGLLGAGVLALLIPVLPGISN